jgi:hypothetical protein
VCLRKLGVVDSGGILTTKSKKFCAVIGECAAFIRASLAVNESGGFGREVGAACGLDG